MLKLPTNKLACFGFRSESRHWRVVGWKRTEATMELILTGRLPRTPMPRPLPLDGREMQSSARLPAAAAAVFTGHDYIYREPIP
jgi:hypothetical protein